MDFKQKGHPPVSKKSTQEVVIGVYSNSAKTWKTVSVPYSELEKIFVSFEPSKPESLEGVRTQLEKYIQQELSTAPSTSKKPKNISYAYWDDPSTEGEAQRDWVAKTGAPIVVGKDARGWPMVANDHIIAHGYYANRMMRDVKAALGIAGDLAALRSRPYIQDDTKYKNSVFLDEIPGGSIDFYAATVALAAVSRIGGRTAVSTMVGVPGLDKDNKLTLTKNGQVVPVSISSLRQVSRQELQNLITEGRAGKSLLQRIYTAYRGKLPPWIEWFFTNIVMASPFINGTQGILRGPLLTNISDNYNGVPHGLTTINQTGDYAFNMAIMTDTTTGTAFITSNGFGNPEIAARSRKAFAYYYNLAKNGESFEWPTPLPWYQRAGEWFLWKFERLASRFTGPYVHDRPWPELFTIPESSYTLKAVDPIAETETISDLIPVVSTEALDTPVYADILLRESVYLSWVNTDSAIWRS